MGISNPYIGSDSAMYWYWAPYPKGVRSMKKRIIKKYLKKTGWLKVGKSQYTYMLEK